MGKTLRAWAIAGGLLFVQQAHADVTIGISVGVPAPPPVIVAPPALVIVPGTPVYYVPSASFDIFVYGGRYYSLHNGAWFFATSHKGPWAFIATDRVPRPVLGVPVTYYKIPPGQAKRMGGEPTGPPGHVKGPRGKKGKPD
ncbi:MAG: hypothetical protein ACREKS_06300 [Candidatus Rokuibacteriota bacterium]